MDFLQENRIDFSTVKYSILTVLGSFHNKIYPDITHTITKQAPSPILKSRKNILRNGSEFDLREKKTGSGSYLPEMKQDPT